jgi:8-oxo-dGTP diphosphatase
MKNKPIIRVVKLIIQNKNGQVLAIRRSSTAEVRPLTWDFPGGIIEANEDVKTAAIRETMEETGLVVDLETKLDTVSSETNTARIIEVIYTAKAFKSKVILSSEHDKHSWIEPELLKKENFPGIFHKSITKLKHMTKN